MRLLLLVGCVWALGAALAAAQVVNPRVTTDSSMDTSSAEAVVKQILKPQMTDEAKAVACWKFMLDHFYHWTPPREPDTGGDVRDFAKAINSYGYGPCFVTAPVLSALWEAAGYQTRSWTITGHSIPELSYGGTWHMLDADARAWHRKADGAIASVEELSRDANLHTDPPGKSEPFYPFGKPDEVVKPFTFWGPPSRMMDLYLSQKNNYRYNRRAVMGHPMYITLRQGETLTLNWHNDGKFVVPPKMEEKFLEGGPREVKGRWTFGNGKLFWKPDFAKIPADQLFWMGSKNVKLAGGKVVPEKVGEQAVAVFRIWCPYVLVEAKASLTAVGKAVPKCAVSIDGGVAWSELSEVAWLVWDLGTHLGTVDLTEYTQGRYEYLLKVTMDDGSLAAISFDNIFQLSQLALPRLKVGRNKVKVFRGPDQGVVQLVRAGGKPAKPRYLVDSKNLEEGGVRPPGRDGTPAYAVYKLKAPAKLVALSVGANMTMDRGRNQKIEALYSLDDGKSWTSIWKIADNMNRDNSLFEMDRRIDLDNPAGAREVLIKFEMVRRSKYFGVNAIRLYGFYEELQPADAKLALDFTWQEEHAHKWIEKKKSVLVDKFPYEFEVDCGGAAARPWHIEMTPAP